MDEEERRVLVSELADDIFEVVMEGVNLCHDDDDVKCLVARRVIRLMWERLISPLFRA